MSQYRYVIKRYRRFIYSVTFIQWCLDISIEFDIFFYNFKHEQNAVHMADGYARALNDPNVAGVCIAQNGPGITNFVTGK